MELYLIRHGIAAPDDGAIADRDRPLTADGRRKTEAVAERLASLNWSVGTLRSSPLLRARQTAEILTAAGRCDRFELDDCLTPDGRFDDWLCWYTDWRSRSTEGRGSDRLALVGHEPHLSQWSDRLLGNAAKATIVLKKAGIIGLALPEQGSPVGRSQLFWLTPPRLFL